MARATPSAGGYETGCVGVVTDTKPEAIGFYEALGFIAVEGATQGVLQSEPTPMFLGIATIAGSKS